jgi:N-acetylneuraminic acid mutarotase
MKHQILLFILLLTVLPAACGEQSKSGANADTPTNNARKNTMQIEWERADDVPLPRGGYFAAWTNGGLWIAGGSYWKNDEKLWTNEASFFDPKSGKWSTAEPIPKAFGYGVTASIESDIYILGGADGEGKPNRDIYRLRDEKWTKIGETPAEFIYPAYSAVGSSIYIFGGSTHASDVSLSTNETHIYDTETGTWSKGEPLPGEPREIFSAASIGTDIYVFGGLTQKKGEEIANLDDAYRFDTTSGKWSPIKKMPIKMRAFWAGTDGENVFLIGGYSDAGSDSVYRYSPKTDEYELISKLPQPLMDTKFIYNDGHFYGASGEDKPRSRFPGFVIGTINK